MDDSDRLMRAAPRGKGTRTSLRSACGVLLLACSGCTTWQTNAAPSLHPSAFTGRVVRVTKTDGSTVTVYDPQVVDDSVFGWSARRETRPDADSIALAMSDVQRVDRRVVDPARSAFAVLSTVAGITVVGLAVIIKMTGAYWSST